MATQWGISWPPLGRNRWPLTRDLSGSRADGDPNSRQPSGGPGIDLLAALSRTREVAREIRVRTRTQVCGGRTAPAGAWLLHAYPGSWRCRARESPTATLALPSQCGQKHRDAVDDAGLDRAGADRRLTRRLLACGALAGPSFVTMFMVEGARRPGYDPVRHPVSSLALGPGGWQQTANFLVAGALYVAGAVGMARDRRASAGSAVGPVFIGAAGAGMIGSGAFLTDPVSGYPPGTPDAPPRPTRSGVIHDLSAIPTFLGLPAAQLAFARSFRQAGCRGWAAYSAASAGLIGVNFVLASAAFGQAPRLVRYGGVFQRLSVSAGFAWLTAIFLRAQRAITN
jgi:Protein of unknown function (DUF998)